MNTPPTNLGLDLNSLPATTSLTTRDFTDYKQTRSNIEQNVFDAVMSQFPLVNSRYTVKLTKPKFDFDSSFSLSDQKSALLKKRSLYKNLTGHLQMVDNETGQVVDATDRAVTLARVPYMTDRGTFINKGNEYTVTNQSRLMEGVYARQRKSGEYEAHFNTVPGGGQGFRLVLDPKTAKFYVNIGQGKAPIFPVLKALGVTKEEFTGLFGEEIAAKNLNYSVHELRKLYEKITHNEAKDLTDEELMTGVKEALANTRLSSQVTRITLGLPIHKAGSVPLRGTLKHRGGSSPYLRVTVPQAFTDSVYQTIRDDDKASTPVQSIGAFVDVITPSELQRLNERMDSSWKSLISNHKRYTYSVHDVQTSPLGAGKKEYAVKVSSPDLSALRESFGLTATPSGGFKIIIGVTPSVKMASTVEEDLNALPGTKISSLALPIETLPIHLGTQDYTGVTKNSLLRATQKIFNLAKGQEEADDRDSLAFQRFMGPEDFFRERIEKDAGGAIRSALFKTTYRGDLTAFKSRPFDAHINSVLIGSGLGEPIEEVNPVEIMDQTLRVTRTGEGGISSSMHGIPKDTRNVQPSHLGFIDPIRTPESAKAGVDLRLAVGAVKGSDGQIYTKMLTKGGRSALVSASKAIVSTIAFPGEVNRALSTGSPVRAMVKGHIRYVSPEEVDYEIPNPQSMFNINSNLVPGISGLKGQRLNMGSKFFTQALPLQNPEAPLVQAIDPDSPTGASFDKRVGKQMGAVYGVRGLGEGVVSKVSADEVTVKYGKEVKKFNLYNNFPFNRKTFIHSTPLVEVGNKVKPGQILAKSNYTDGEGNLALGSNLRVAYMVHGDQESGGALFEDGIIISESAAKKMASEHMYLEGYGKDDDFKANYNKFISLFPGEYTDDQLKTIDKLGVVKPGTIVNPGDPLILGVGEKNTTTYGLRKKSKDVFLNRAVEWKKEAPGVVTDVVKTTSGYQVAVKAYRPMKVGDKLVGRFGDKGIISSILPDSAMPQTKGGESMEVLLSSLGLISRVNPIQAVEAVLGKVAKKLGKPIKMPAFMEESNIDFAQHLLDKSGLSDVDDLVDPGLNKKVQAFNGYRYFMNLHHQAESKLSGRSTGGYSAEDVPARGGDEGAKRFAMADIDALLAHGAINTIRDARLIRGQKNEEYWKALKKGLPTPPTEVPFVWEKFVSQLKGAGVNVTRKGGHVNIYAMTKGDIDKLATHRLKSGKDINAKTGKPEPGGLFDEKVFGQEQRGFAYIPLTYKIVNPVMEDVVRSLLDVTQKQFEGIISKEDPVHQISGIEGVEKALKGLKVDEEITNAKRIIKSSRGQNRSKAIKKLKYLSTMKDRDITPDAFIWDKMPVLPPVFRPITDTGKMLLVSDANYLYKELFNLNESAKELKQELGSHGDGDTRLQLYKAAKTIVGLSDPASGGKSKKIKIKGGLLKHILGDNPKFSMFQRKVLSTAVDNIGNGVITPDPALDMDHVGIPEKMAFKIFKPYIIKRMVHSGVSGPDAIKAVKNKTKFAREMLVQEMDQRPVLMTRAPVLHKYGMMGARGVLTSGDTIKISPSIVEGFGADFDGDTMRIHVPSSKEAVKDILTKMLPSRNVLAAKNFESPKFIANEFLLGLNLATAPSAGKKRAKKTFETKEDVVKAFNRGELNADDVVEIIRR